MLVTDEVVVATFRVLDLAGVLAAALLGGTLARSARLDPVGFGVIAILSGLGGGIIRDTLLQQGPPVALTDHAYVTTALVGALVAYVLPLEGRVWTACLPVVDAVAVGCWSALGAQKTLTAGLGWFPTILLGTITAVGGSAVRDVVLQRVPHILGGGRTLYATSATAGSAATVALVHLGVPSVALVSGTLVGAALTLLAGWRGWRLREAYRLRPTHLVPRGRRPGP